MAAFLPAPFTAQQLRALQAQLDTPALLIVQERLQKNILAMQALAKGSHTSLRPHTKTHKSPQIARWQLEAGAQGITVAKLSEAEVMAQAGFTNIFIANQITHPLKLKRLRSLHEKVTLIVGLDHPRQIALLRPHFENASRPLNVRIEIDSGLQRCGVPPDQTLLRLAQTVMRHKWLNLEGIFTHAGQAYAAQSREEIEQIGHEEGALMAKARALLAREGITIQTVSVGSTPTVPFSAQNNAVNEIRPGNYVFYDAMQLALGAAGAEDCSLFVLATVTSRPRAERLVVDAGSKALHTDGAALTGHFGLPLGIEGRVVRLSEEHGILQVPTDCPLQPGDPLLLLPNHACAVVNLFDAYYLVDSSLQTEYLPIEGRGKSQ